MRVLFLYDDSEHAVPLLRAAEHFARMGIEFASHETHSTESAMRLVDRTAVDVLLLHQPLVSDDAFCHGKPVAILERIDGAQLAASRRWLPSVNADGDPQPSAAAVIKGYTFRDGGNHNARRGRYHAHLLDTAGIKAGRSESTSATQGLPNPQLSTADLRKIVPGYGFGAYAKMDVPRQQLLDYGSEREYDVHCVGYVDYNGSEIETHRNLAIDMVEAWGEANPGKAIWGRGRCLRPAEYLRSMFAAKTVVSPWGWGEACHRDYEAWLLGAVLIKPSMGHVSCWPDVYRAEETYIPCRMDFSDLPEIISRIRDEWPHWRERREAAREQAMHAGDPKRIAKRIADILASVI